MFSCSVHGEALAQPLTGRAALRPPEDRFPRFHKFPRRRTPSPQPSAVCFGMAMG